MRALLIGYNDGVLAALDDIWPAGSVVVIEEPDLWAGKKLAAKAEKHRSFDTVHFGRYQQDQQFLEVLVGIGPVNVVAAGLEYAVEAAAEAAQRLGLRGAGVEAAGILRDKLRLREVTTAAGMRGPGFREVRSAIDVAEFASGRDCVLKPAGRQASLGVVLLDAGEDPEAAWAECVSADEGNQIANRSMRWRYLVEERLRGPEFSTEALVADRTVIFTNVTRKQVSLGRRPVELGHLVPGATDQARWQEAVQSLVDAVGYENGLLHAEWIDTMAGPCLIECAGRPPGDKIMELIDLAYDINLTDIWLRLLAGEQPGAAPRIARAAAIQFLAPVPGVVQEVTGVPESLVLPGVVQIDTRCEPGQLLGPLRSSWDRLGWVIATGADGCEAENRAVAAASHITVRINPEKEVDNVR